MKTNPLKFDKTKVISFLKTDADGHSILDTECFIKELGFNLKQIKPVIKKHTSNLSYFKQTIYLEGKIIPEIIGVDCLDFLYWFATKLGISTHNSFRGRGVQARFLTQSILGVLESK